jgi:hypothetical protein
MSDIFEPVAWSSNGDMRLADGDKEYLYVGVTKDIYRLVQRMCRQGRKGEVYQMLKTYKMNDEQREVLEK